MSVSALKKAVDALSRYADVKAKAEDPRSKIGVQVDIRGNLTLIAGSSEGGILYRVSDIPVKFVDVPFIYAVDAKPLLQAVKALKAKSTVSINASPDQMVISTSDGGSITLKYSCSIADAGFVSKPKNISAYADINADTWEQIYRIIPCINQLSIEPPTLTSSDGEAHIVSVAPGERPMYARYTCKSSGVDGITVATYLSFWEALKVFEAAGQIAWGNDGIIAKSQHIECWGQAIKFHTWDAASKTTSEPSHANPWPILSTSGSPTASFTFGRTQLIDIIRGATPSQDNDQYGRITLNINEGGGVTVRAFGDESDITFPAKTSGKSVRSIRAEYLVKLLRAAVGKDVTINVYKSPPLVITSPEMSGWLLLVAPVVLG